MENRLLYRGKKVDDGEWVEGFYIEGHAGDAYIAVTTDIPFSDFDFIPIDAATRGQCTGIAAAKSYRGDGEMDRLVFEGDVVKCSHGCPHEVIWRKEYGGMFGGGMPAFYLSDLGSGYAWTDEEEILGNIHDNPELLDEVNQNEQKPD